MRIRVRRRPCTYAALCWVVSLDDLEKHFATWRDALRYATPQTPAASCAPAEASPSPAVERPPTRGGGH